MPTRVFQKAEIEALPQQSRLPVELPVALYYRQSTEEQVGNVSTDLQTKYFYESLQRMGWTEDRIYLIDADAGVSGTLKISEREGMRQVYDLIVQGKIGAVAAQDEDRLFRDLTMIQVNIFIEECSAHQVCVITPRFTYEFHHPVFGWFHKQQFRMQCERAAEYINTVVLGKLGAAKRHLMRTGRWAGGSIPVGFMVDARQNANGAPNPNFRKYVPFEPFAEVIRRYYELFIQHAGDVARTFHYIYTRRIAYPDPNLTPAPDGFVTRYMIAPKPWGYGPGRRGLTLLLTNPAYIGHWVFQNVVVQWHNHEPIVPEDVFWEAFNYLSAVNLDGSPNPNYRPAKQNSRPRVEAKRTVDLPLCKGLITALVNGKSVPVSTEYKADLHLYTYICSPKSSVHGLRSRQWARRAYIIDDAVSYYVLERLRLTFNKKEWIATIPKYLESSEKNRAFLERELQQIERDQQAIIDEIGHYSIPAMIEAAENKYRMLQERRIATITELEAAKNQHMSQQAFIALSERCEEILASWEDMTRDEKHAVIRRLIDRMELVDFETKRSYTLIIHWQQGDSTTVPMRKGATGGKTWTYAELELVRSMIAQGARWREIRQALPHRPKASITSIIRSVKNESGMCSPGRARRPRSQSAR